MTSVGRNDGIRAGSGIAVHSLLCTRSPDGPSKTVETSRIRRFIRSAQPTVQTALWTVQCVELDQ